MPPPPLFHSSPLPNPFLIPVPLTPGRVGARIFGGCTSLKGCPFGSSSCPVAARYLQGLRVEMTETKPLRSVRAKVPAPRMAFSGSVHPWSSQRAGVRRRAESPPQRPAMSLWSSLLRDQVLRLRNCSHLNPISTPCGRKYCAHFLREKTWYFWGLGTCPHYVSTELPHHGILVNSGPRT